MEALYTDGTPVAEGDFVRYHQTPGGLMAPPSNLDGSIKWDHGVAIKYPYSVEQRERMLARIEREGYGVDPDELHLYGKGGWCNADGYSYFHMAPHIIERWEPTTIAEKLDYLRGEIRAERISYGEIAELQGLVEHIDAGDVELLEAAGVPEHEDDESDEDDDEEQCYCTYCDYYSRESWSGKQVPGSTVFTGTREQVIAHADEHPIGSPEDMALPISERAPYEGDE